jgi:hypothetical protein
MTRSKAKESSKEIKTAKTQRIVKIKQMLLVTKQMNPLSAHSKTSQLR